MFTTQPVRAASTSKSVCRHKKRVFATHPPLGLQLLLDSFHECQLVMVSHTFALHRQASAIRAQALGHEMNVLRCD